jgi:hypothetical protein
MRKLLSALILILGLAVAPVAAHADSFQYNFTLTSTSSKSNVPGGSGYFIIDTAAPTSGNFDPDTLNGDLSLLTFSIGGDTFDTSSTYGQVAFQNGNVISVVYNGSTVDKSDDFSLNAGAMTYIFQDIDNQIDDLPEYSKGVITIDGPPVDLSTPGVVPEPSTLLLFGTGVLGIAGIVSRKLTA